MTHTSFPFLQTQQPGEIKIDPLRERIGAVELRDLRALLARGGLPSLLQEAQRLLAELEQARTRFEHLSRSLDGRTPDDRRALVAQYLRETVTDPIALKGDLAALEKKKPGVLDVAALGERIAILSDRSERCMELSLALIRAALRPDLAPQVDVRTVIWLAQMAGRWSRRAEALECMADLARLPIHPAMRNGIAAAASKLSARTENRWVQVAALAALGTVNPTAGHANARDRLTRVGDGDDFIVRARIVELIIRFRDQGWWDLLPYAFKDPSDLVRLTAVRVERKYEPLAGLAFEDPSYKVRAAALIALAKRSAAKAQPILAVALERDKHDFVVQTAAEELAELARGGKLGGQAAVMAALARATQRTDLGATVRTACADILAEIDVLTTPLRRAAYEALKPVVEQTPVGGSTRISSKVFALLADDQLGRVLSVLSKDDYGLGVDRVPEGIILYRGEPRGFAAWRALYELKNPTPSKRQAFIHTWGRKPRGALRAPPGGMAELTATQVPGERVMIDRAGGWGRHLPLVDDLLSVGVMSPRPVSLTSAYGLTRVVPSSSFGARLRSWVSLTLRYPALVQLRRRSLESDEVATQTAYLREVADHVGVSVTFSPFAFGDSVGANIGLPVPIELAPAHAPSNGGAPLAHPAMQGSLGIMAAPIATALYERFPTLRETTSELVAYSLSSQGNRLPELAGYALAILGGMLIRTVLTRRAIESDRRSIPLVVGGWGTRGKSGTERLKAGLFQGLGHEVLVKTTGCEAMFIHAVPGVPAREIFIYRPYDKATVWEQREVLKLGARLGVRVFLYECMALQPDLVNLIQHQWMRDDCSTITNAYPDHEDVQGPAGFDVATVISEFVPTAGKLFTSEDQMLPIMRERAKELGTTIREVTLRDSELISQDLLARFPYQEHPKNIALVASLARGLGVSALVAIVEMADHVVPDLGVLKTYPTVPWRGRNLTFSNGMSANERTGAIANWRRTGFDKFDPDKEPGRWVVTVVNNRGDRIARSEVFARFLVEDIAAHRHVLIGSNVGGLVGFIKVALDRYLIASSPTKELAGSPEEMMRTARSRLERAFAKLKVGRLDAASVQAEFAAFQFPPMDPRQIEQLLMPGQPGEPYEAARKAVEGAFAQADEERRPFMIAMVARRRAVRAVYMTLEQALGTNPAAVDQAFGATYRALFNEGLVPLLDYGLKGDQIIDIIAQKVPPGANVSVQGVQNIKGTGLDFVYRWVSTDMVAKSLAGLASSVREEREKAIRELMLHDDYGLVDASMALTQVEQIANADPERATLPYEALVARLREIVATRTRGLSAQGKASFGTRVRKVIGETLDYLDSMRRQAMARDVVDELVAGRISHASAAIRMRDIVARAKGQWMVK